MLDPLADPRAILVAGGAGFIGRHLCRALLGRGAAVLCLDNFSSASREGLVLLDNHPRFHLIEHDVVDPLPAKLRPAQIYNLACPASPRRYQADPIHTLRTCVQGAYNLLQRASECGARLLQASTSEVYGDAQQHPQNENYHGNVNPVGPRACYDEGKRCAETLCTDYALQHGVVVKIARIFNTYGPGMTAGDGRVVPNFISQALAQQPLTVYGDGTQTRSLCYVSDMVDGLMRLMDSPPDFRGPVNLGNTHEMTILDIASHICRLAADYGPHEIEFMPLPADDPVTRCPDTALAWRHLGWRPRVSLEQGLEQTFRYFEQQRTAPKAVQ